MRYNAIIKKRVRYVRIFTILNRLGPKPNILTKLIMRLASKMTKEKDKNQ